MLKSLLSLATISALVLGAMSLEPPVDPAAPRVPAALAGPIAPAVEGATYVGADACKKCHFADHKSWQEMKHASAWQNLPEEFRDPEKMDDFGRACISCHVTGFGETGGFESIEASGHLLGVQCEACHGPGSLHLEVGQTMLKEKRKEFLPGEESHIVLTTTNCSGCHNPHISYAKKYGGG